MQPNRGSARQGKMRNKQGRDDPSVPAMLEVAVSMDGDLRRPAQEAARPATAALEAALPARVAQMFTPPRFSGSRNPLHPAYLPLHSAPVIIERAPSGPRSPSATSQRGLRLLCSSVPANPAGIRPDGALPLGTAVTPSPRQRAMGDACDSGRNQHEVIHVQP